MKVETTVTLSEELLAALIDRAPDATLRSDLVEAAVRNYLVRLRKRDSSHDLEIIKPTRRSSTPRQKMFFPIKSFLDARSLIPTSCEGV